MGEAVPIKREDPIKAKALELKSTHGEVWIFRGDEGFAAIVRRPTLDEFVPVKVEIDKVLNKKDTKLIPESIRLFRTICLYPPPEDLETYFARFPMAGSKLGEQALELGGSSMTIAVEKV